ncbi:unnamed protein product [Menidia menidia]|uniref:(Atlantic silverside) hypothetical protein n=1 Tax=Menidia menidia TaxID=238744 RepID=A0A8S4BDY5_9TELE|nr:unnamed protein product [Menidia menidia]
MEAIPAAGEPLRPSMVIFDWLPPTDQYQPAGHPLSPQTPCRGEKVRESKVLVQFSLNFFHSFISIFGGRVELLLQEAQADMRLTQLLSLYSHESYSPSCMAVAILFMVAMTELQDCLRNSGPSTPWEPYTLERSLARNVLKFESVEALLFSHWSYHLSSSCSHFLEDCNYPCQLSSAFRSVEVLQKNGETRTLLSCCQEGPQTGYLHSHTVQGTLGELTRECNRKRNEPWNEQQHQNTVVIATVTKEGIWHEGAVLCFLRLPGFLWSNRLGLLLLHLGLPLLQLLQLDLGLQLFLQVLDLTSQRLLFLGGMGECEEGSWED